MSLNWLPLNGNWRVDSMCRLMMTRGRAIEFAAQRGYS